MKKSFSIPVFVLSLISFNAHSQTGDKKPDSAKPAKEIIRNDSGERDFSRQLKENQLNAPPAILNDDSSAKTSQANKKTKRASKHHKKKRS